MSVFSEDTGNDVCLTISQYALSRRGEYRFISSESGCVRAPDALTIDTKDLSEATIAPTTVTLTTYDCTQRGCRVSATREVVVAAIFTGTGEVMTFSSRSTFDDGTCTYTYSGKGIGRNASASITLNDMIVDGSGFLSTATSLTKVQCR